MYWQEQKVTCNEKIRGNIRKNTFSNFMQYIHVADHTNFPESTKIDRVWEYFSELQKNFLTQAVCGERMRCWWVHGQVLQEVRQLSKAINFPETYSISVQCAACKSSVRDHFDFEVYEGSTGQKPNLVEKRGLAAGVILDLADRVTKGEDGNHKISITAVDKFLSSFSLIKECSKRNLAIIGTRRQNRVENALISNKKAMMKIVPWQLSQ